MSNSPLVSYTRISPNKSRRTEKIIGITPHYMAGNCSIETCGEIFAPSSRQASSNYGIGSDGRVGLYVPEDYRAWTSSSSWNDQRRVTIEVANIDSYGTITQAAWDSLVNLCVDICQRNGISSVNFTGDKYGVITWHCMFSSTSCPGQYLKNNTPYLVDEINKRLWGVPEPEPEPPKVYPEQEPDMSVQSNTLTRLYNPYTSQHLVTTSPSEIDGLEQSGWTNEGSIGTIPMIVPVYRLYNEGSGDHLYTANLDECNNCIESGWKYEGVAAYGSPKETNSPIYRLYNPYNGLHLLSDSKAEVDNLVNNQGWNDEGILFYAI